MCRLRVYAGGGTHLENEIVMLEFCNFCEMGPSSKDVFDHLKLVQFAKSEPK